MIIETVLRIISRLITSQLRWS